MDEDGGGNIGVFEGEDVFGSEMHQRFWSEEDGYRSGSAKGR